MTILDTGSGGAGQQGHQGTQEKCTEGYHHPPASAAFMLIDQHQKSGAKEGDGHTNQTDDDL